MRYNPLFHPRRERVTSRTAGYDCVNNATVRELKGGVPKNRPYEEGDDSDPGLASRRGCVLTANASRPEAVGWAPLVGRRLPPSWDCGSVAICPVQWWSEGRAATLKPTK